MNEKNNVSSRILYKNELLFAEKLIVKRSNIHRWGVFAKEEIQKYEIIEEFPYFVVSESDIENINSCLSYTYGLDENNYIIGMGFCGLYNHSFNSNVDYEIDKVNEIMRHYAIRDIEIGEELTLNYGEKNAQNFN